MLVQAPVSLPISKSAQANFVLEDTLLEQDLTPDPKPHILNSMPRAMRDRILLQLEFMGLDAGQIKTLFSNVRADPEKKKRDDQRFREAWRALVSILQQYNTSYAHASYNVGVAKAIIKFAIERIAEDIAFLESAIKSPDAPLEEIAQIIDDQSPSSEARQTRREIPKKKKLIGAKPLARKRLAQEPRPHQTATATADAHVKAMTAKPPRRIKHKTKTPVKSESAKIAKASRTQSKQTIDDKITTLKQRKAKLEKFRDKDLKDHESLLKSDSLPSGKQLERIKSNVKDVMEDTPETKPLYTQSMRESSKAVKLLKSAAYSSAKNGFFMAASGAGAIIKTAFSGVSRLLSRKSAFDRANPYFERETRRPSAPSSYGFSNDDFGPRRDAG